MTIERKRTPTFRAEIVANSEAIQKYNSTDLILSVGYIYIYSAMSEYLAEVIVHLDSERLDLRTEAATALIHILDRDASLEIDSDGLAKIFRCFLDTNNDLSSVAAALLTNLLAGTSDVLSAIDTSAAFAHCVTMVKKDTIHTNTFLMFLSNMTIDEAVCSAVFAPPEAVEPLRYLLDLFLTYNPQAVEFDGMKTFDEFDIYQHAGSFICNMCRLESFRRLLSNMEHPYLGQFFDQVRGRCILVPIITFY
jgi:hypothetical protein